MESDSGKLSASASNDTRIPHVDSDKSFVLPQWWNDPKKVEEHLKHHEKLKKENYHFKNEKGKIKRNNFSDNTKKELFKFVNGICSKCYKPTTCRDGSSGRVLEIGEAAHILPASENGPRYDATLKVSDEYIRSEKNGLWLCHECHRDVDQDVVLYTSKVLIDMKREAEEYIRRKMEYRGDLEGLETPLTALQVSPDAASESAGPHGATETSEASSRLRNMEREIQWRKEMAELQEKIMSQKDSQLKIIASTHKKKIAKLKDVERNDKMRILALESTVDEMKETTSKLEQKVSELQASEN